MKLIQTVKRRMGNDADAAPGKGASGSARGKDGAAAGGKDGARVGSGGPGGKGMGPAGGASNA